MREVLKRDEVDAGSELDVIHVELDVNCSDMIIRETMDMVISSDAEIDTKGVISRVKEGFLDNYKNNEEFCSKYSKHVSPGDDVELTVISWIRQPKLDE